MKIDIIGESQGGECTKGFALEKVSFCPVYGKGRGRAGRRRRRVNTRVKWGRGKKRAMDVLSRY